MSQSSTGGVKDRVINIISEQLGVDKLEIKDSSTLISDLGSDSLDQVELIMRFEEEFDIVISDEEADKMATVGEITKYIEENS